MRRFLHENLALTLNPKARRLQPVSNGVNFLGYIVRADYLLVRRRVVGNLREKLAAYEKKLVFVEGEWRVYDFNREELDNLFATFTSYLGHCKHADSFRLVRSIWRQFDFRNTGTLLTNRTRPENFHFVHLHISIAYINRKIMFKSCEIYLISHFVIISLYADLHERLSSPSTIWVSQSNRLFRRP